MIIFIIKKEPGISLYLSVILSEIWHSPFFINYKDPYSNSVYWFFMMLLFPFSNINIDNISLIELELQHLETVTTAFNGPGKWWKLQITCEIAALMKWNYNMVCLLFKFSFGILLLSTTLLLSPNIMLLFQTLKFLMYF